MTAKTRKNLSSEVAHICWQKGTEPPFSGKYNQHYTSGSYHCVNCDARLFTSDTKYDSGSGWPSFWEATTDAVRLESDHTLGMLRTEVLCNMCGAHLGHVFDDGPQPTGKRYCINSLALEFHADEKN